MELRGKGHRARPSDRCAHAARGRRGWLAGVLVSAVAVSTSGCAVARAAGKDFAVGAVTGLRGSDSAMVDLQRRMADTAFALVGGKFDGAVLDPARATWAEMRRGARDEGDSIAARLDQALTRSLSETIPRQMGSSGAELQRQLDQVARSFAVELARSFGEGITASLQPAVDSLVAGAVRTSAVALETDLRPSVHALMLDLRDSLRVRIGDVDRAVARSRTVSDLRYALVGGGAMLSLLVLLAALGRWKRRDRALDAVIDAIERVGDPRTKQAVHHCATEAGVGGWLGQRVRHRTTSGEISSPGREP